MYLTWIKLFWSLCFRSKPLSTCFSDLYTIYSDKTQTLYIMQNKKHISKKEHIVNLSNYTKNTVLDKHYIATSNMMPKRITSIFEPKELSIK